MLRALVARSGGNPALLRSRPRLTPVPRPVRRALLAALDELDPAQAARDMLRHRRGWIAVGERLHPGEHAEWFPRAALAFAVLRGSVLDGPAAVTPGITQVDGRAVVQRWAPGRGDPARRRHRDRHTVARAAPG